MSFIGSRVKEKAKECKEIINNRLNPTWLEILPDGCTEVGYLIALRGTFGTTSVWMLQDNRFVRVQQSNRKEASHYSS